MSTSHHSRARVAVEIVFVSPSEGGRQVLPVGSGYAPYLRTGLVSDDLAVRVHDVPATATFGDVLTVSLELCYYPEIDYGPLKEGVPIQLVEGPRVVARGHCKSGLLSPEAP
jgi:hypothetical protein